jgi:hypothetical protein
MAEVAGAGSSWLWEWRLRSMFDTGIAEGSSRFAFGIGLYSIAIRAQILQISQLRAEVSINGLLISHTPLFAKGPLCLWEWLEDAGF